MTDTPVKILWTGGWDSSFRVLHVAVVEGRRVEPHYIIDTGRRTTNDELRAISRMRDGLKKLDQSAAERIASLCLTPQNEIPKQPEISNAWKRLKQRVDIAWQYDLLARYAQFKNLAGLELCVEKEGGIYVLLKDHMWQTSDGTYRVKHGAIEDGDIFARFEFPVLEYSKGDMRDMATKHGFLEILDKSWFCHRPISKKPCGMCAPCIAVMKHGLEYRIPTAGIIRYHLAKFVKQTPLKRLFQRT